MNAASTFLRRVTLRNYKSIAACRVELAPLTFLVGPNGSGKSNFLDALRLTADALRTSLDHALRERGTIREVRRRSGGHPNHFAIRLDFTLPTGEHGWYAFRVGAKKNGAYEVQEEECSIGGESALSLAHFRVENGEVREASFSPTPAVVSDRLFLVAASGTPQFRPVYDALSQIEVYNLNPRALAALQKPDPGDILRRDGSNASSVLQHLNAASKARIDEYLERIVPGVSSPEAKTFGPEETIEFRQVVRGQAASWRFNASSMSDGTLRALGILLAIFQGGANGAVRRAPLLIGLEEPEVALHPAATSVLLGALREASRQTQIVVTSHSPDLLDHPDIAPESLLAVDASDGLTTIGAIDEAGRSALRDRLFTPGELLRQSQLQPSKDALRDVQHDKQLRLFDDEGER
ncbi:MAG: AAA family ATPase [Planctomycetes bacterium]|nr:AAA family ATPase [Planctomycetota bacterium]MCC7172662.1 AAA family ATPase [Planctomycetota bacterium]